MDRPAAPRIDSVAGDDETLFLIKRDRPRIFGIDVEIKPARRDAPGLGDKRAGKAAAPMFRRDDDLVEIKRGEIDGDETDHFAFGFGHDDARGTSEAAPVIAPPREAHGEVDAAAASLPAVFPASRNSCSNSRCMVSLPATTLPFCKMASPPSISLIKPPASRTKSEPAARSQGDRSRSQ